MNPSRSDLVSESTDSSALLKERALFLIGSPLAELESIVEATKEQHDQTHAKELDFDVPALRQISDEYILEMTTNLARSTEELGPYVVKVLTGWDILQHALRAEGSELLNTPVVNLAPHTFLLRQQAESLHDQVAHISDPHKIIWNAPVIDIESSPLVFHELDTHHPDLVVGVGGRTRTYDESIRSLFQTFSRQNVHEAYMLDDRARGDFGNMLETAQRLTDAGLRVKAYIVGHVDCERFTQAGSTSEKRAPLRHSNRIVENSVKIIAPVFRWDNIEHANFRGGRPAAEIYDLGYFSFGGHSIVRGYLDREEGGSIQCKGASTALAEVYRLLQDIYASGKKPFSHDDFARLESQGVEILDTIRLEHFFDGLFDRHKHFTERCLHQLFSHSSRTAILRLTNYPDFNVDLLDRMRAPMLWPGTPQKNELTNWMYFGRSAHFNSQLNAWSDFSLHQLALTKKLLENIEQVLNTTVPAHVLGLYGIPNLMSYVPECARHSNNARDIIAGLHQTAEEITKNGNILHAGKINPRAQKH